MNKEKVEGRSRTHSRPKSRSCSVPTELVAPLVASKGPSNVVSPFLLGWAEREREKLTGLLKWADREETEET